MMPAPAEPPSGDRVPRGTPSLDERVSTLHAYRRARGLCYLCGERWACDHKCATAVQLHVVQELFDVLGLADSSSDTAPTEIHSEVHTISKAAVEGELTPQTIRLQGHI